MADPLTIITLILVGILVGQELIKIVIKITKFTVRSTCCTNIIDLHESNHNMGQ